VKAILISLCLILAPAQAQQPVLNPHNSAADRAAGAKIFRSHCAPCHGSKGTGGTGPNLTTGVFFHGGTDADLYRNIGTGIPGTAMPDVFFDGVQVWQIVAFVRSLSEAAVPEQVKGNAVHGGQLVREKGCLACHLMRGEGGSQGPDLSLIGSQRSATHLRESLLDPDASVPNEYWVAKILAKDGSSYTGFLMNQDTYAVQILDFSRGLVSVSRSDFKDFGIDRTSVMPSYKGKLSDSELDDIVACLVSLKRQKAGSE
jgi:putative heme-binding domain-containing protein